MKPLLSTIYKITTKYLTVCTLIVLNTIILCIKVYYISQILWCFYDIAIRCLPVQDNYFLKMWNKNEYLKV